jgi:hypothetical protein
VRERAAGFPILHAVHPGDGVAVMGERMCGEVDVETAGRSYGADGAVTRSVSRRIPVLTAGQIRTPPRWHGLVMYEELRAVEAALPRLVGLRRFLSRVECARVGFRRRVASRHEPAGMQASPHRSATAAWSREHESALDEVSVPVGSGLTSDPGAGVSGKAGGEDDESKRSCS